MSYKATGWAYAQPVTPSGAKFVLVALADYADESHSCYPGQQRLADMTGQSVESVRRHLKALEEDGYLSRTRRVDATGYRTSDRYTLNVADGPTGGGRPAPEDHTPEAPAPAGEGLPGNVTGRETQTAPTPQSEGSPTGQSGGVLPGNLLDLTGQSEGVSIREPLGNRKGGRSASRRKPETVLPDSWKPTTAHQVYATEHGLELASEAMKFRTHAAANDRRQRDWDAAFSMWLMKAREMGPRYPLSQARPARAVGDRRPEGW